MTSQPIHIERCLPASSDWRLIANALHQASSSLPDPLTDRVDVGAYAKKLSDRADILLAREGDTLAGLLAMYATNSADRLAFVSILVVYEAHRSRGIGARLISEAVTLAEAAGNHSLWLKVHPSNLRAQKFYSKHDFALDGEVDGKIRMTLRLDKNRSSESTRHPSG